MPRAMSKNPDGTPKKPPTSGILKPGTVFCSRCDRERTNENVVKDPCPECGERSVYRRSNKHYERQKKEAEYLEFLERARPVLDFYRDQIMHNPDLAEHRSYAALVLAEIESFKDKRHIRKAVESLRFVFGHDRKTIRVERGGDFDRRMELALAEWARITGKTAPGLEVVVEPRTIEAKVLPQHAPIERPPEK